MQDAFALFNLPRSPWLNAASLREDFHRQSASLHPDAGGDAEHFAQLNAAYESLRTPASRLRHLLELEAPELLAQSQEIPPALADRFMRVAAARQESATFLAKLAAAATPLARALLTREQLATGRTLKSALSKVKSAEAIALVRLRDLERIWRDHLPELASLHADFSYVEKWIALLRDAQLELDLATAPNLKSLP